MNDKMKIPFPKNVGEWYAAHGKESGIRPGHAVAIWNAAIKSIEYKREKIEELLGGVEVTIALDGWFFGYGQESIEFLANKIIECIQN